MKENRQPAAELATLSRQFPKSLPPLPEKVIQFGTGNFLKGFVDWIIQRLNDRVGLNAGIVAVKLRAGNAAQIEAINAQQGLFTVNVRGREQGRLVDSFDLVDAQVRALSPYQDVSAFLALAGSPDVEWVISNTTEAGICFDGSDRLADAPAATFPAKLTQLLYRRYQHFGGDPKRGWKILCCELIENNGGVLRDTIKRYAALWDLEPAFGHWLDGSCRFYNTLVDRIVPGPPDAARREAIWSQLGYRDLELIETEPYYQWVIEAAADDPLVAQFPAEAGLNLVFTEDLAPYRARKVRILNGAHTACVSLARLLGIGTVYQAMQAPLLSDFMAQLIFREVCPTIPLPAAEVRFYAESILDRFHNPYLQHEWTSIGLNSLSKWRARLLPTLKDQLAAGADCPLGLSLSLAALLLLYRGEFAGADFALNDNREHLALIKAAWREHDNVADVARVLLAASAIWGEDLNALPGLTAAVARQLAQLTGTGVVASIQDCLRQYGD